MYQLIVFGPLVGALVAGLFTRSIGDRAAQVLTTSLVAMAALLSWWVFLQAPTETVEIARWIQSGPDQTEGSLLVNWSFKIDALTRTMLIVVTSVSALVHLYSFGYMDEDPHKGRFFAYLSLFTFAMLMLVTADNFLQMFFGWEGVGLASYLLIGFWWKKPTANAAAIKAFVVNRVGDFGYALGIVAIFLMFDTLDFAEVFEQAKAKQAATMEAGGLFGLGVDPITVICFLLFIGAMGKSAQLFLHTWLPDAMEGPTPVSALIHAATMVTAGVFLVCRCSPLFELAPSALHFVTIIGATTALFAATIGLVQHDIKRVIAYSTCSQLGYMFFAAGVGAYEAAMFHLLTHAFFKALLFLGAGSVIHAMHHEQDMRNYGGLLKKIPLTGWTMFIGTLAITGAAIPGVFGLAGYYSKDMIIEAAFASHNGAHMYAFWIGVIAAVLTSFYSWRLWFKTFLGKPRGDMATHSHAHESPLVMMIPLYVLSIGAVLAGVVFYDQFVHEGAKAFWGEAIVHGDKNHVLHDAHGVPKWVKLAPFAAMLLGLAGAVLFYILAPGIPNALARRHPGLLAFLENKWYFDELYNFIFVRPARWIGRTLWRRGDGAMIDGAINGVAMGAAPAVSAAVRKAQSGFIFRYASVMIFGIVALVTWIVLGGLG
ncbi:MAG: NADH-quinone oxidoreductase subunit L [Neomegalonema sp.]|nr:NADH-quinone oxidoreductase subunit L [Neomegalonema sp.]